MRPLLLGAAAALMTAACINIGPTLERADAPTALAVMRNADGEAVGTAVLQEFRRGEGHGVRVTLVVHDLPPGKHGVHLHAIGKCEAPDFGSAGGHFNPEGKQHGLENEDGPHAGDLENLEVAADGTATQEFVTTRARLHNGDRSLLDEDGVAVVIHAGADDQKTDPSGDSGARIACGVVQPRNGVD